MQSCCIEVQLKIVALYNTQWQQQQPQLVVSSVVSSKLQTTSKVKKGMFWNNLLISQCC